MNVWGGSEQSATWASVDKDPTPQVHPLSPLPHVESSSQDADEPRLALGIGPMGSVPCCHWFLSPDGAHIYVL